MTAERTRSDARVASISECERQKEPMMRAKRMENATK